MSLAEAMSLLGAAAAAECEPEALRDAVCAVLHEISRPGPPEIELTGLPSHRAPPPPLVDEAGRVRSLDVPYRFRLALDPRVEVTPERGHWLRVVQSHILLWTQVRRVNAYNRFASDAVDALRLSPSDDAVVPRLELVASLARNVKGVAGALVIALDGDERTAAFGASGIGVESRDALLNIVARWLERADLRRHSALALIPDGLLVQDTLEVRGYPMFIGQEEDGKLVGLLVVSLDPARVDKIDQLLVPFARLANWILRDALRGEVMRRLRRLQELVVLPDASRPPEVVRALADIFLADVVSLFLDDHGSLRLAASTDKHLSAQGGGVTYERGEGITGWIFQHGEARRFVDAAEADEFRRSLGADAPKHPERAVAGERTARLLSVPMRHGNTVVGVLRMSRVRGQPQFTQGEEDALRFFADVLGALLVKRWQHQVAKHIQALTADAVYLARAPRKRGSLESPIVYEHEGAARLYGRSSLLGLSAASLYSTNAVRVATERALRGAGSAGPEESFTILPDGSRKPIELSFRLLENDLFDPPSLYWLVLARDVSERKRRTEENERMRAFLDHVRIAYFRSDLSGRTPHPTDLDCEITGYSRTELTTLPRSVLYADPKDRDSLVTDVRAAGGRLLKRIVRLQRRSGETFLVEADLRLLQDDEGREAALEGFYREVTDRVTLQSFLDADTERVLTDAELFAKLRDSASFQQDYLLSLGHQLKAPLVALMATLRNFERRIVRADVAPERMAYVLGQTRVCIDLVHNLSFLGRILKNEPLVKKDVPLARTAIRVKLDLMHLLREKRLNVVVEDEALDQIGRLRGDPDVLRQVFVNLLDNAIKYSFPDTTIRITGRPYSSHAVIDFISEGLEIPYALRDRVFERGYRTPQAAAIVPHGTGLGLWLVRRMLHLHGARIECVSESAGSGRARNRFRITFPRQS